MSVIAPEQDKKPEEVKKPVFQFNPDAWDDDAPRTNAEGVKLCKIADPDCEACQ